MRLLILGASGGVGRWLTRLAAEHGHDVTALARPTTPFEAPPAVDVRRGDVLDPAVLDAAVPGQDAVLSCLGIRRAGKIPWARMLSPADFTACATEQIAAAMRRHGVHRIIAISAGGVADSFSRLTWPVRKMVSTANIARQYSDLAVMEQILAASGLDWLVVRPVTLMNGRPRGTAHPVERYRLTSLIRRSDVAAWMLAASERPAPFADRRILLGY